MKQLEDIENMDLEALEEAALKENAPIPEGLTERISGVLAAESLWASRKAGPAGNEQGPGDGNKTLSLAPPWILYAAATAAAIALAVLLPMRQGQLHDTFDDPRQAYLEVEQTFQRISLKMAPCKTLAENAAASVEKPSSIIRKINKR